MENGPRLVRDLGNGWSLRRWEYDGAALQLHGPIGVMLELDPRRPDEVEMEVEHTQYGCCSSYSDTLYRSVPVSALRALLGL